jgi:CRP-like cAMP-binding protein
VSTARASGQGEDTTVSDGMRKADRLRNRILARLPRKEYAQAAYFLDTATVSILSVDRDGTSIEVSLVGDEGMVGMPIVLRSSRVPYRIVVQRPGIAWKMKADVLLREFDRCGPLHKLVLQYAHTLIMHLAQSAACNRFHTVQQRLSRWLLTSQDRTRSNEIRSTQEFLSQMLGVNRGSASQAASALQKAGLIRYLRGQITIVDRPGLEAASCECYRIVKAEVDRFFRV